MAGRRKETVRARRMLVAERKDPESRAGTHARSQARPQTDTQNEMGEKYITIKCSHGHHHGNKRSAIVLQGTSCNEIISIFCRIIVLSSRAEEEDRLRVSEEARAGPAPEEERGMETCFIFIFS